MQKYTTEFNHRALILSIDEDDYEMFMKYTSGLADYIWRELNVFTVETIDQATVKAVTIKTKSRKSGDESKSGN